MNGSCFPLLYSTVASLEDAREEDLLAVVLTPELESGDRLLARL